ncbi:MAG: DinB family protein [Gemmatimonadetes bacterium]|nr:MAG: DinB family protein [Gemmatimonadota bacterium]
MNTIRPPFLIERLRANTPIIQGLIAGVSMEQARWKPAPEKWSILEVINHLYDEEREDFRQRLDYTLHKPGADWPPINPQKWVTERRYNERDLAESLHRFLTERQASLEWLHQLENPNWEHYKDHPIAPRITANRLLACWVAHDLLHIRQLNALHWAYLNHLSGEGSLDYAGEW